MFWYTENKITVLKKYFKFMNYLFKYDILIYNLYNNDELDTTLYTYYLIICISITLHG